MTVLKKSNVAISVNILIILGLPFLEKLLYNLFVNLLTQFNPIRKMFPILKMNEDVKREKQVT